ncbi:hypothetical protein BpHYR1_041288 [Brachionus plicatilis]|uniref:Uncharacterized protein n=1 Tax=Brachionus plicatilis TaxID=10195 RepID=A0A3M7QG79_BRAPC|nr:hypothetical protein BpHYR1_041288 [Brachionus plicatilis]
MTRDYKSKRKKNKRIEEEEKKRIREEKKTFFCYVCQLQIERDKENSNKWLACKNCECWSCNDCLPENFFQNCIYEGVQKAVENASTQASDFDYRSRLNILLKYFTFESKKDKNGKKLPINNYWIFLLLRNQDLDNLIAFVCRRYIIIRSHLNHLVALHMAFII